MFSTIHGVLLPDRRQRLEQYRTLSQSFSHFFLHVKVLLQTLQVLSNFLIAIRSTRALFSLRSGIEGKYINVCLRWLLFLWGFYRYGNHF